jgi:hypothetical protein
MKYKFTDLQVSQIIDDYSNKMNSVQEISKKYSVDNSVIKRVLKENGVDVISGTPFSFKYWMKRGFNEEGAKHKVKTLKPRYKEYWINKGLTEEESVFRSKNFGDNGLESCINNHGEIKGREIWNAKLKKNSESNKKKSKRRVEYWIETGYSEDEAKSMVKETQRTFTKEKCVEKYGEEEGLKIFFDRQNRWFKNFNKKKSDVGGFDHNSFSVDFFKKKYGDDWEVYWVNRHLNHTKNVDLYKDIINQVSNLDDLQNYLMDNKNKLNNKNIRISLYNSVLLRDKLSVGRNELRHLINNILDGDYVKSNFGVLIREGGVLYRSKGDYEITKFLNNLNIKFEYEKPYPNSKKRCDFYIPSKNLYIEYTGMLNINENSEKRKNILRNYRNNLKKKMDICLKNDLKCLFLSDTNSIKKIFNNE